MKIELERRKGKRSVPIAYDAESNELNIHLLDFAIYRKKHPKYIHKDLRKANDKTTSDSVGRVAFLINKLNEQEYKVNGKIFVGVHYLRATYEDNMEPIRDALRNGGGDPDAAWKESSLQEYVKAWRAFYRFLTATGVEHYMDMPDTIEYENKRDQETNLLSHTNASEYAYKGETETAVDQNAIEFKDDFYDDVISMEMFWDLYAYLYGIDPVYAVMACCQVTSLLRVSALVRDFPIAPTPLNPSFLTYPQIERQPQIKKQKITYISKGGKKKKTNLPRQVHQILHTEYIAPQITSDTTSHNDITIRNQIKTYQQRLALFKKDYCSTKHALNQNRTSKMKPAWLLSNGTPVSNRSYQDAFEQASKALGFHVHNHMMRHTGATQFLWRYLKMNNLTASHTNHLLVADAHVALKKILGHQDISTTKKYVKTIERMVLDQQMDSILNYSFSKSKEHHQELAKNNPEIALGLQSIIHASKEFDTYMTGK